VSLPEPLQPKRVSQNGEAKPPLRPPPKMMGQNGGTAPPPRPPPPKVEVKEEKDVTKANDITKADDEESFPSDVELPSLNMPKRNPKLYQLTAMASSQSSFWWDSVDANALKPEDDDFDEVFKVSFDESLSVGTIPEEEEGGKRKREKNVEEKCDQRWTFSVFLGICCIRSVQWVHYQLH